MYHSSRRPPAVGLGIMVRIRAFSITRDRTGQGYVVYLDFYVCPGRK